MDDIDLCFSKESLRSIARQVIETKTCGRGWRKIIENVLMDIMFEYGGNQGKKRVLITEGMINGFTRKEKVA